MVPTAKPDKPPKPRPWRRSTSPTDPGESSRTKPKHFKHDPSRRSESLKTDPVNAALKSEMKTFFSRVVRAVKEFGHKTKPDTPKATVPAEEAEATSTEVKTDSVIHTTKFPAPAPVLGPSSPQTITTARKDDKYGPPPPQVLTLLAPKIAETIAGIVNACYHIQVGTYRIRGPPPKDVRVVLSRHRDILLSTLYDPRDTARVNIVRVLIQAQNVAQDIAYVGEELLGGQPVDSLMSDSARRTRDFLTHMEDLLEQERQYDKVWSASSEVICKYLQPKQGSVKGFGDSRPDSTTTTSPSGNTVAGLPHKVLPSSVWGYDNSNISSLVQTVTSLQASLEELLRKLCTFWEGQNHIFALINSHQMTMTKRELKGYVEQWKSAEVVLGRVISDIKLSSNAYIRPRY